jgi:hypothetical protein
LSIALANLPVKHNASCGYRQLVILVGNLNLFGITKNAIAFFEDSDRVN